MMTNRSSSFSPFMSMTGLKPSLTCFRRAGGERANRGGERKVQPVSSKARSAMSFAQALEALRKLCPSR